MIYSSYLPDRGMYEYFATTERRGLGDDLPVPKLEVIGGIAAASTEAGRSLPRGARRIGHGLQPKGSITPLDRRGLAGLGLDTGEPTTFATLLALSALVGFVLGRSLR